MVSATVAEVGNPEMEAFVTSIDPRWRWQHPNMACWVGCWLRVTPAVCAAHSDGTGRCRRYFRLHWLHLFLMLARQVLGAVHNDQDDRYHAPQR